MEVVFVRHAQSTYNKRYSQSYPAGGVFDEDLLDARLTEEGRRQVELSRAFAPELGLVRHCFVSPLSRAIETALLLFEGQPAVKYIVVPELAERLEDR